MTAALDAVPTGLLSLSEDLRILAANRSVGEMVCRNAADLAGEFFDALLTPPARILFQTHIYPVLKADGSVEEAYLTLATAGAEPTPILLNASRSTGSTGPEYQVVLVRIRARSHWEADLLAATRALARERASSERMAAELAASAVDLAARHEEERRRHAFQDAFIGVVSHELRTPITTIYGMSHVLRGRFRSLDPEVVGQHLDDIAEESDRLRRLTEDLLVLSRAEGGKLVIADDPVLVAHVVRAAVRTEQVRSQDHRFDVDAPTGMPLVFGDATYVEQVIRNLLSNAVKYSPAGTTISVRVAAEEGGVAVRVIDAGPGLPEGGAPEQLFELFYRAPSVAREKAGAGIGLFVCRELVGAMGGRIWAAPARPPAANGAEFGFWLPAGAHDDPEAASPHAPEAAGRPAVDA